MGKVSKKVAKADASKVKKAVQLKAATIKAAEKRAYKKGLTTIIKGKSGSEKLRAVLEFNLTEVKNNRFSPILGFYTGKINKLALITALVRACAEAGIETLMDIAVVIALSPVVFYTGRDKKEFDYLQGRINAAASECSSGYQNFGKGLTNHAKQWQEAEKNKLNVEKHMDIARAYVKFAQEMKLA